MTNNENPFNELSNRLDGIEKSLAQILNIRQSVPDEILTIDEAELFTKIRKKTLYQYTSRNLIPYLKPGKHLLFRKSDLCAWLNSHLK